ncbi:MAG TPA: hypothetical protein VL595_18960 [Pseudonocardia sp.]|nr:hypothetical protein [Pseudonocardia sp.]
MDPGTRNLGSRTAPHLRDVGGPHEGPRSVFREDWLFPNEQKIGDRV